MNTYGIKRELSHSLLPFLKRANSAALHGRCLEPDILTPTHFAKFEPNEPLEFYKVLEDLGEQFWAETDLLFLGKSLGDQPNPGKILKQIHANMSPNSILILYSPLMMAPEATELSRWTSRGFHKLLQAAGFSAEFITADHLVGSDFLPESLGSERKQISLAVEEGAVPILSWAIATKSG